MRAHAGGIRITEVTMVFVEQRQAGSKRWQHILAERLRKRWQVISADRRLRRASRTRTARLAPGALGW